MLPLFLLLLDNEDDRRELEQLYHMYSGPMYRVALALTRNAHDAEDALQTSFLALTKHIGTVRTLSPEQKKSYVFTTVRRAAFSLMQKRQAESLQTFSPDDEETLFDLADDYNLEKDVLVRELIRRVRCALKELPEKERLVLISRVYDLLSEEETAQRAGLSPSSVRKYLERGRKHLSKLVLEGEKV